jgi:hypothetical protein
MKEEGMVGNIDVDLDNLPDKEFVSYRKTKPFNESLYKLRYNFFNLVTKHYTRKTDDVYDQVRLAEFIMCIILIYYIVDCC